MSWSRVRGGSCKCCRRWTNVLPGRLTSLVTWGWPRCLASSWIAQFSAAGAPTRRGGRLRFGCLRPAGPQFPVATTGPATARYFLPGGDVRLLSQGTTALVVPYGDNEQTMGPYAVAVRGRLTGSDGIGGYDERWATPQASLARALISAFSPYVVAQSLGHPAQALVFTAPLFLALLDRVFVAQNTPTRQNGES